MARLSQKKHSDAGQVTILMLALVLALLTALPILGAIGELLVHQQRLNAKADSVALAGALELEFNQTQACDVVLSFNPEEPGLKAFCKASYGRIDVTLIAPNPIAPMGYFLPKLSATASAGIDK